MVSVNMHFFGKPCWELVKKITLEKIKFKGNESKTRLCKVAGSVQKISTQKWKFELNGCGFVFNKNLLKKEAQNELDKLGIKKVACEMGEGEE